jgi:hypothetical protein
MSSERNYHNVGDPTGGEWHWAQAGVACTKLLALLEKHHKREPEPAPAPPRTASDQINS